MNQYVPQGKFRTACGSTVDVNERSVRHLQAHPEIAAILVEAISKASFGNLPFAEVEVELGRTIGQKTRVSTRLESPDSTMTFAIRNGRDAPSRIVVGVGAEETSSVVIIAKRIKPGSYVLITSWIGCLAEKEPWDKTISGTEHFNQSLNFWCQNALIHDPETMGAPFESSWSKVLESIR